MTVTYVDPKDGVEPLREMKLSFPLKPVSLQGSRRAKKKLQVAVGGEASKVPYLYTGEVRCYFEWFLHERIRYEGLHAPDVDNIIKPILDALSGPSGIIVNDCQVQAVDCRWIDWKSEEQRIDIVVVPSDPDEYITKEGLVFLEMREKLCIPLDTRLPVESQRHFVEAWMAMFERRTEAIQSGQDYYAARNALPLGRAFHRARLKGFKRWRVDLYRAKLAESCE